MGRLSFDFKKKGIQRRLTSYSSYSQSEKLSRLYTGNSIEEVEGDSHVGAFLFRIGHQP